MYAIIFDCSHFIEEAMTDTTTSAAPLTRVERKRQEARNRIIDAAAGLFRARGVDAVTIQDITSAADVGHGTFYLHFKSKHEVLVPIMIAAAAELDARIQRCRPPPRDPAEVLATSSRFIGSIVVRDELWRWFLKHSGLPGDSLRKAFGEFTRRDFRTGLVSGRFAAADPGAAATFCFGGDVSVLMASLDSESPQPMIDQAAETMLRVLGVSAEEAREIAHRALPAGL